MATISVRLTGLISETVSCPTAQADNTTADTKLYLRERIRNPDFSTTWFFEALEFLRQKSLPFPHYNWTPGFPNQTSFQNQVLPFEVRQIAIPCQFIVISATDSWFREVPFFFSCFILSCRGVFLGPFKKLILSATRCYISYRAIQHCKLQCSVNDWGSLPRHVIYLHAK